ncbi:MAG: hypothetical protein JWN40_4759 [Phycisphaerales bacterium]|nr:hypothetical protein [Phycisphaerales bacterium]
MPAVLFCRSDSFANENGSPMIRPAPTVLLALITLAGASSAQQGQGIMTSVVPPVPATAPAVPPYRLVLPPGYEKVTAAGHTALCLPADAEWVKKALTETKPATRPTTMPADLLKRVTDNRAAIVKQMVADLALPDDKQPNRVFDEQILPTLKKLDALKPPVYFLICTREQLRELTKAGWGEPRFHYNRLANEASVDDNIVLSLDRPMGDSVLPVFYTEKETPDTHIKNLAGGVQQFETEMAMRISQQSQPLVFNLLAEHIGQSYFDPMKLRRDQQWLALGVTGYLTSKYAGQLTPSVKEDWLKGMTFDDPRFPVSAKAIDLAHPVEETAMRPMAVPYYNQALRRKSMMVVVKWAEKGGDASITKTVAAIRAKPPADGATLVKLIQDTTGVDLAQDVAPQ